MKYNPQLALADTSTRNMEFLKTATTSLSPKKQQLIGHTRPREFKGEEIATMGGGGGLSQLTVGDRAAVVLMGKVNQGRGQNSKVSHGRKR